MDLADQSQTKDLLSPSSIHASTPEDTTPARKAWGDTPTSSDSDLQALALQWELSKKMAEQGKIAVGKQQLDATGVIPKKAAAKIEAEDTVRAARPVTAPETGGTEDVSDSSFHKVDVALPSSPALPVFRPRFVKVTDNIANIIGSIGDTLLYVETEVSGMCRDARVWVLGSYETIKRMFEQQAGSVATRLASVCNIIRSRSLSFSAPLYASLSSGVLQIWGSVGGAVVCVQVWASQSWTAVSDCTVDLYCAGRQRARHFTQMLSARFANIRTLTSSVMEPHFVKIRDGYVFLQARVGGMFVKVQLAVGQFANRVKVLTDTMQSSVQKAIVGLVGPAINRIAAMYDFIKLQMVDGAGPLMVNARDGSQRMLTMVSNVTVAVKVKALDAGKWVAKYPAACYIKVKDGVVYIQGAMGTKAIYMKMRLADITDGLKTAALASPVMSKVLETVEYVRSSSVSLGESFQGAAADKDVRFITVSAVGGATVLGTGGGAVGLATGSAVGAACGAIPAMFTFGLSIPVGTAIGGGAGLCVGTVTGGAAGLLGGGLIGRTATNHRERISDSVNGIWSKANDCKEVLLDKAGSCRDVVAQRTGVLRLRCGQ